MSAYIVNAKMNNSAVAVIMDTPHGTVAKVAEYREGGYEEITVTDMAGQVIDVEALASEIGS